MKIKYSTYSNITATVLNILLAYVVYMLCRIAYVCENWSLFAPGWQSLSLWSLLRGGVRAKERGWWQTMTKWIYVAINSLAVVINLCDAVYSQYTGRRTTSTFFHEFSNENKLGDIFFIELLNHWYLVLAGAALIAMLWLLYTKAQGDMVSDRKRYHITQGIAFAVMIPLAFIGMRGGLINTYRPVSLADANQYVNQPNEAAIVLNTPFSIIRTVGKTTYEDPKYFDDNTLTHIYNPIHTADSNTVMNKKNVVILIVESFGREYIGFYNRDLEGGKYKGYTPFIDSLLEHSMTWEQTYANGRTSIDGMPAVLASIPTFVEPFFFTSYSLNRVSGLPGELGKVGYSSAFFHGADNGSMGFQAAARAMGFDTYYGRNEYDDDPRFGGEKDFDGTWAIWDEPFLQYFATKMGEMQEPFITAVFTASSFENTVFVITSDHTNMSNHDIYRTPIGVFCGPIIIYDPSGQLPTGVQKGVAQQIDIMPTVLGMLGYPNPFVAFGRNLMDGDGGWTVNYTGGIYQYLANDTLIQFNGKEVTGTYCLSSDPMMTNPLPVSPAGHTKRLKAIIQQYMQRMLDDKLTVEDNTL